MAAVGFLLVGVGVAARFERTATPLTRLSIVVGWSKLGSPDRYVYPPSHCLLVGSSQTDHACVSP